MAGIDEILKRAQGLRALRDRGCNRNEAEAAARALAALLDKHQLEEASLGDAPGTDEPVIEENDPLFSYKRVVAWKLLLASTLCTHYGVALLRGERERERRRRGGWYCFMVGRHDDLAIVRYLFAWLSIEATRLLNQETRGAGAPYRRGWMIGFVAGIRAQLLAARAAAWARGPSTALAVLNDRERRAWETADKSLKVGRTLDPVPKSADARGFVAGRVRGLASRLANADELPPGYRALPAPKETS